MINRYFIGAAVVLVVLAGIGFSVSSGGTQEQQKGAGRDDGIKLAVHKSPTCDCCGVWASYMERQGYRVDVHETADLGDIKADLGVPSELESCHTSEVGGYVVEGHIPNEAIEKLLAEKPDIKGIGMPGMPSGSPGMPGAKTEDFVIYEITREGTQGDVFMVI